MGEKIELSGPLDKKGKKKEEKAEERTAVFLFSSFCSLGSTAVCQSEDRRGEEVEGRTEKMGCRTLHLLVFAIAAAAGEIDLGE